MKRRRLRVLAASALVVATTPTVLLAFADRAGAATAYSQYALTSVVRASSTDGNIGASGGLTPLDSGSASIDATLDNSPSATVLARPVEPGTSFTTVNSQLPVPVPVPEADAAYPGNATSDSVAPVPTSTASGTTSASSAHGEAESGGGSAGGLTIGSTTASTDLTTGGAGQSVHAVADAFASGFDAGVLEVAGVRGHADIMSSSGGKRTSTASLTVGSITVAGQSVVVDDTGVHAAGMTTPLGPTLDQLTAAANSALATAGVTLSLLEPVHSTSQTTESGSAIADSGGLQVTTTTPGAATFAGNVVTVTLGRVQLSESDAPPFPVVVTPTVPTVTTVVPGTPGQPGTPARPGSVGRTVTTTTGGVPGAAPAAAPSAAAGRQLVLAGRHLSARAAIAALGGWEGLTLSTATFAVLALRRGEEDDEDEVLCPCPA